MNKFMDRLEKIGTYINHILSQINKGNNVSFDYSPKNLGLSDIEYSTILIKYGINHTIHSDKLMGIIRGTNDKNLLTLLQKKDSIDLVVKFIDDYNYFNSKTLLEFLRHTGYNLKFFIGIEDKLEIESIIDLSKFIGEIPEKLLFYILHNEYYQKNVRIQSSLFYGFTLLPPKIQMFVIDKKIIPLTEMKLIELMTSYMISGLNSKIKDLLFSELDIQNMEIDTKLLLYVNTDEYIRKKLFPEEKIFLKWVKSNNLFPNLNDTKDNELIIRFLREYPKILNPKYLDTDVLATIKFSNLNIPEDIKKLIKLPTKLTIKLDGDDIAPMVYSDRDNSNLWVKYVVDEELWEHTIDWDYSYVDTSS